MAGQSGYSGQEILSMQNDAVRRVNEMQRLARERVKSSPNASFVRPDSGFSHPHESGVKAPPVDLNEPNHTLHNNHIADEPPQVEIVHQGFAGILEKLNLDDEKLLLILLIILLINEGADTILILALGFILLC